MAVLDQKITDRYAIYNGDAMEVLPSLPDGSIHGSIYSPPFALESGGALYHYSSSDRDLSNSRTFPEFMEHYGFIVREIHRLTMPGRTTAVHCIDIPSGNTGHDSLFDFPGEIIRLHESIGWEYTDRYYIWKDPWKVRLRTMAKTLAHKTVVEDSTESSCAGGDYLLRFRKRGKNPVPVAHPIGLTEYAGSQTVPPDRLRYRGWTGNQIENLFSHWVWRQYASSAWLDVRLDRVLPFKPGRDPDDEKHVHPLQLDVIQRYLVLNSNPGERILTPFMGVGSETWESVRSDRFGIGIELKPSYYKQTVNNLEAMESIARSLGSGADDEDLLGLLDTAEDAGIDADPTPV